MGYCYADTTPKVGFRPYLQTDAHAAANLSGLGQGRPFEEHSWQLGDLGDMGQSRVFDPWELGVLDGGAGGSWYPVFEPSDSPIATTLTPPVFPVDAALLEKLHPTHWYNQELISGMSNIHLLLWALVPLVLLTGWEEIQDWREEKKGRR